MIAQEVAAEHPDMLRRVILLGTAPRGGEDLTFADLSVDELDDSRSVDVARAVHAKRDKPDRRTALIWND